MAKKPIRVGKVKRKSNIFYGVRLFFIKDKKNLSMKKKVQVIVHLSTVIIGYLGCFNVKINSSSGVT
jgi:hypothetical protein